MAGNSPGIQLKNIWITGDLVLAPMDGYSSWPFRSICRELGSAISYTEFVKDEDVLLRPHYIKEKIFFTEAERPVFFQLYGQNPERLLQAALNLQEFSPDAIDINLGCPNRSITSRGAGAGLMRTPQKTARIFKTLTSGLRVPVTAKIRLGWQDCQNQLLIARIVEAYGGALLAVHARPKEQGHQGKPDLIGLAEIKQAVKIPVLGNGGVEAVADINTMKNSTNCDGVMIGRAAINNPWIFSYQDRGEIKVHQVKELMLEHLERSLSFFGKPDGLVVFRKFAAGYLNPYNLDREKRKELLTEMDPSKFVQKLNDLFLSLDQ